MDVWIFGYGSLMWDGWENAFGCRRRDVALLPGYRRVFNKASVVRWGSTAAPGPTLNIEAADGSCCTGLAFAFACAQAIDVRDYLVRREGRDFHLRQRRIDVAPGEQVDALVPIYEGTHRLDGSADDLARMVCCAAGSGGSCIDYVKGIATRLAQLQIHDAVVVEMLAAVERFERSR